MKRFKNILVVFDSKTDKRCMEYRSLNLSPR
jgi:hypothetical protein